MPVLKPVSPKLDTSSSLVSGLVFDAQLWEGFGTTTNELINQTTGTITASGATWEINTYGQDLDFSTAASSVNFTTPASVNSLTQFSVEGLLNIRTTGGGGLGRLMQKLSGTAGYFILFTSGSNTLRFQVPFSSTVGFWDIAFGFSAWHHYVVTYNMGNVANVPIIYLDGVSQSFSASQTPVGTAPTDDTNLYIGNRSDGARNLDGKIAYTRIWNRILSSNEALSLYQNPWRIYLTNFLPNGYRHGEVGDGISRSEGWT